MKYKYTGQLHQKKFIQGYTLVETLVAISIFSVSILGLLITLSQGIADTGYAKKKIAGAYLAQEGVEYLRNLRDTYMIYDAVNPENGWNLFRSKLSSCGSANGCYFNADNLNYADSTQPMLDISVSQCGGGACPVLLYSAASGRYGYSSGQSSGFTRKIQTEQIGADELKIISTVSWTQGSGNYSVSLSENLFNWIE